MKVGKPNLKWFLFFGIFSLLFGIISHFLDLMIPAGPCFITGLFFSAIGFQAFDWLKSYSYTVGILTAVTVSMCYPQFFRSVGGIELKIMIIPLLQIIMFGMGSQLSLKDFHNVIKMPKGVIVGLMCQFSIMPFLGFAIAKTFGFPLEIAAGVVLIGCAPSGLASNVMSYIAKANVPLSVTITSFATLLAPFLTPALMKLLAGAFISIDFWKMMIDIINMVILPIVAGLLFNSFGYSNKKIRELMLEIISYSFIVLLKNLIFLHSSQISAAQFLGTSSIDLFLFIALPIFFGYVFRKLFREKKEILEKALSVISMIGIGIIITIITAAGRDSLMQIGLLLIIACFLHNTLGYFLGYWFSRFLRLDERSCRTVAIEVGMQNGGLASGIALQMGKISSVGLAAAVFGPLMNVTGSSLASWWRRKTLSDEKIRQQINLNKS
jgi:BASS family bile acid:Na+ symporter